VVRFSIVRVKYVLLMKQNIYNSPAQLSSSADLPETRFSVTNAGLISVNSVKRNY